MNTNFSPRSQPTLTPPSGAAKVADSTRPAGTLAESGQSAISSSVSGGVSPDNPYVGENPTANTGAFAPPIKRFVVRPPEERGISPLASSGRGGTGVRTSLNNSQEQSLGVQIPPPGPNTQVELLAARERISKRDALRVTLCGEMQGHYGFLIEGDQSEPFRRDIFIAGVLKDVAKYRQAVKALEEKTITEPLDSIGE